MSVQDKQLAALEKRQKLFKEAALAAKQQGQTDTAKEYLRQALGLNKLIEVIKSFKKLWQKLIITNHFVIIQQSKGIRQRMIN